MEFIQLNSTSVPYNDTNFKCDITNFNETIKISNIKVSTKQFEQYTYYKFELPNRLNITSIEKVYIRIIRDDGYEARLHLPITDNIIRVLSNQSLFMSYVYVSFDKQDKKYSSEYKTI